MLSLLRLLQSLRGRPLMRRVVGTEDEWMRAMVSRFRLRFRALRTGTSRLASLRLLRVKLAPPSRAVRSISHVLFLH
jgi:hypothetical protein